MRIFINLGFFEVPNWVRKFHQKIGIHTELQFGSPRGCCEPSKRRDADTQIRRNNTHTSAQFVPEFCVQISSLVHGWTCGQARCSLASRGGVSIDRRSLSCGQWVRRPSLLPLPRWRVLGLSVWLALSPSWWARFWAYSGPQIPDSHLNCSKLEGEST